MNRRRNKSRQQRPLSVIQHCSTSPILRGSCTTRPSSALGTAAPISSVSVAQSAPSFAVAWPDTNNNSNCYSSTWNNIEITELSHSPTNCRRRIFTFGSPTDTPAQSPPPSLPSLESESPAPPPLSSVNESPDSSPSHSVATPSPAHSPPTSRKDSSEGVHSDSPSPQSTPVLGQTTPLDRRDSSPSSECSSLHKFADLVSGESFSTNAANSSINNDRRYMVLGEIIDTERKYIRNLEVLLNGYLPALEHVVAPRDLRLLFPAQLEPIMEKHRDLLSQLEGRVSADSLYPDIVGDIFARLCGSDSEFLNIYSAYLNEFKVAVKTLAKYEQSSSQFRELLSMCQHSPFCEGLSLASYLLTPVQRLPRYELLLKELLKHTPIDHPDNYYVADGIEKLHGEMIRLNQSIKSCQLACSVRRVQSRKSFRFSKGVRRSTSRISAITPLKRHVSTTNIDELSGGDSCLYRSEESLPGAMGREEGQMIGDEGERGYHGHHHHHHRHSSTFMTGRAISCSDLLLDLNDGPKSTKSSGLAPLDSIPSTPEPPKLTSSPIIVMRRNAALITSDVDGAGRSRSRLSTYSTTSSTSGIGSIDQSQLDLTSGSLTPTEQQPHPLCSSTPIHSTRVPVNSFLATIQQQMALASIHEDRPISGRAKRHSVLQQQQSGRKMSWAHFRLPLKMKKGSRSASLGQIVDISAPMDFRHIQHGFSPSEVTPTNSTPIVQSPTITDNSNPGSNNTLTPS